MAATTVIQRLRTFLLVLSACLCAGTIAELVLAEHTETAIQFIPFALCGVALIAVIVALARPRRATLIGLRLVMALMIAGSCYGVLEHVEGNLAFELEIHPNASASAVWLDTLKGAAPLLAPGILALAAMLAIAATYYHPALERHRG